MGLFDRKPAICTICKPQRKHTNPKNRKTLNHPKQFFVVVSRKSDPSVQFRFEDELKGKARTQALKKCFIAGHDDCEVSLIGVTK